MTVRVTIHPEVLKWALGRSGLSEDEIIKRHPSVEDWLAGSKNPTLRQAKEIAKTAHLPLGRLLLPVPTPEKIPIPDFRTVRNTKVESVGANLREVIQTAEQNLSWYAEYASEIGIEPPRILGIAAKSDSPEKAANKMREMLSWGPTELPKATDKVMDLVNRMEEQGLLVMRNSVVRNSTNRKLDVHEFRGFMLRDGKYALVFVNTADSKTAQLFSLAHELGHVAKAAPGISGDQGKSNLIEQWCNKFAAALLIPKCIVRELHFDSEGLSEQLAIAAPRFGVSREALLWRLVELEMVSKEDAYRVIGLVKHVNEVQKPKPDGRPPFDVLVRARVGRRFLSTLAEATQSGALSEPAAAEYLGIQKKDSFDRVMAQVHEAV